MQHTIMLTDAQELALRWQSCKEGVTSDQVLDSWIATQAGAAAADLEVRLGALKGLSADKIERLKSALLEVPDPIVEDLKQQIADLTAKLAAK